MLAMESAVLDRGRQVICADQNLYAAFPASCVANCNKQFILNFIYCVIPAWAAPAFFLEFRAHFHTMISNPFHNFLFVCNLFDLFSKSGVRCCVISEACKIVEFWETKATPRSPVLRVYRVSCGFREFRFCTLAAGIQARSYGRMAVLFRSSLPARREFCEGMDSLYVFRL
jgi:hypothetical protein